MVLSLSNFQSFTLMSICWGAIDFGAGQSAEHAFICQADEANTPGYDNANQTAYLDSTIRWGIDWLINVSTYIYYALRIATP